MLPAGITFPFMVTVAWFQTNPLGPLMVIATEVLDRACEVDADSVYVTPLGSLTSATPGVAVEGPLRSALMIPLSEETVVPTTGVGPEDSTKAAPTNVTLTAKMAKTTIIGDAFFINFVVIKLPAFLLRKTQFCEYLYPI